MATAARGELRQGRVGDREDGGGRWLRVAARSAMGGSTGRAATGGEARNRWTRGEATRSLGADGEDGRARRSRHDRREKGTGDKHKQER
jgi:hypothetical protein